MDAKKIFNTIFDLSSLGIDITAWEEAIRNGEGKDATRFILKAAEEAYDRQAAAFFEEYNKEHPDERLYAHGHYDKPVVFFICDEPLKVKMKVARFKHAYGPKAGETFTFFGSMLISGTSTSRQLLDRIVKDEMAEEKGTVGSCVSEKTAVRYARSWSNALMAWKGFLTDLLSSLLCAMDPVALAKRLLILLDGHLPMEKLCR